MSDQIGKDRNLQNRKKSFSSHLEKLLLKYEQRNIILQEKEANIRTRVEMMEAAMPILLAWNMYHNSMEEETNESLTSNYPMRFTEDQPNNARAQSENDIQKRKEELDRLIREIRRREKLDTAGKKKEKLEDDSASQSSEGSY